MTRTKKKRKGGLRKLNIMAAYPSDTEAVEIRKVRELVGESESRYLVEGALLRGRVLRKQKAGEMKRAERLATSSPASAT